MAICEITGEECPEGCWLIIQRDLAETKLLKPATPITPVDSYEGKVIIARKGIQVFERYEGAIDAKKERVRIDCPNCPNLNQI